MILNNDRSSREEFFNPGADSAYAEF